MDTKEFQKRQLRELERIRHLNRFSAMVNIIFAFAILVFFFTRNGALNGNL